MGRKVIERNSPESFAICRRIGEADREKYGRVNVPTPPTERHYKPAEEWKPRAKVTDEIIEEVRRLSAEGRTLEEIAETVGICRATAARIKGGYGKYGKAD